MAKKSAAALSIAPAGAVPRLAPPADLTPAQRSVWLSVVNSRSADWFAPEHEPLLKQYVRHKVNSDLLSQQIEEFQPEWMAEDDGLKRYDRLLGMLARETLALNTMARSMRLTHQAVYRADSAKNRPNAGRKPWQSEG